MNFTIRKGEGRDVEALYNLIMELAIFEKEPNAVEITVEILLKEGFSDSPKFHFFVAEEEGDIIGVALFYERFSTWKGRAIHLEDLIVTESKRKLGVGKALYSSVLEYANKNDYNRVAWEVLDWNTNAIDFYESTGAVVMKDWHVVQMNKQNLERFTQSN